MPAGGAHLAGARHCSLIITLIWFDGARCKTCRKTYAGRMFYPSMVDLPFHHDTDLTPKEQLVLEKVLPQRSWVNSLGKHS